MEFQNALQSPQFAGLYFFFIYSLLDHFLSNFVQSKWSDFDFWQGVVWFPFKALNRIKLYQILEEVQQAVYDYISQ